MAISFPSLDVRTYLVHGSLTAANLSGPLFLGLCDTPWHHFYRRSSKEDRGGRKETPTWFGGEVCWVLVGKPNRCRRPSSYRPPHPLTGMVAVRLSSSSPDWGGDVVRFDRWGPHTHTPWMKKANPPSLGILIALSLSAISSARRKGGGRAATQHTLLRGAPVLQVGGARRDGQAEGGEDQAGGK